MLGGVNRFVFLMGFNCERDTISTKGCFEEKTKRDSRGKGYNDKENILFGPWLISSLSHYLNP